MHPVQNENYRKIVEAISKRLKHLLKREANIGRSSRISGSARLTNYELHERLGLLRDKLPATCAQTLSAVQIEPRTFKIKLLRKSLKSVPRAIDRKSFKGMHETNLYNKLALIIEELQATRDVLREGILKLGNAIDPDSRLDLWMPSEVAEFYGKQQKGIALASCISADAEIGHCLSEAWHILKGRFGWTPGPDGGPYEKRRGAEIAAHLIGMGCGLGLNPTRNDSSPSVSACDAAIDARFMHTMTISTKTFTVFNEIPKGYHGMEHIWTDSQTGESLHSHMSTGFRLGERLLEICTESTRNRSVSADDLR